MSQKLSFECISPRVHALSKRGPGGWPLAMLAIELPRRAGADLELVVYSPTYCGPGTFEAVEALGRPTVFVAPNHYHHMSLKRFRERWPDVPAIASPTAQGRLARLGYDGLVAPGMANDVLGDVHAVACEGTKSGELWLTFSGASNESSKEETTLVCCDAFFNVSAGLDWPASWIMQALRSYRGLSLGRTYGWFAVGDAPTYVRWATSRLEALAPTRLVVSHGDAVSDEALASRLMKLIRERL
jgi:hypothetical protein